MFRRIAAITAVSLLATATLTGSPASGTRASGTRATAPTAAASASTAAAGTPVTVSGVATPGAKVKLQRVRAKKWLTVSTGTAAADGSYRLNFPTDWYLNHRVRAVDASTGASSSVFRIEIAPSYTPSGSSSDWQPFGSGKDRWNPCKPITWRINANGGHPAQVSDFQAAFAEMSRATGFQFVYRGTTTKKVGQRRRPGYANILVDWGKEKQYRDLNGSTVGMAYGRGGWLHKRRFIEATMSDVLLDSADILTFVDGIVEYAPEGALTAPEANTLNSNRVLMHELGHVMGLGHVDYSDVGTQMMAPYASADHPQAGDLAGLRSLGAINPCIPRETRVDDFMNWD